MWEGDGWGFVVEVQTDGQRDSILGDAALLKKADAIAKEAAARPTEFHGVIVYSQETVDRDYEGNWFYATR